jgi:hypothetical protein
MPICEATHISGKILDLIICPDRFLLQDISVGATFSTSDHYEIAFSISISQSITKQKRISLFDNIEASRFFLSSINWNIVFNNCTSVEQYWSSFYQLIMYCIEHLVPKKLVTEAEHQHFPISSQTRAALACKNYWFKKFKRNNATINKHNYNKFCRFAKQLLYKDK